MALLHAPLVGLQYVIEVFPDHSHLLFVTTVSYTVKSYYRIKSVATIKIPVTKGQTGCFFGRSLIQRRPTLYVVQVILFILGTSSVGSTA